MSQIEVFIELEYYYSSKSHGLLHKFDEEERNGEIREEIESIFVDLLNAWKYLVQKKKKSFETGRILMLNYKYSDHPSTVANGETETRGETHGAWYP